MIYGSAERIKHLFKFMGANISDWEQSFLESVEKQFNKKGTLTDAQCEKLEQIFERSQR